MARPDSAKTDSPQATESAAELQTNYSKKGHDCTWIEFRILSRMFVECPTNKRRAFFTCETRETFGVHMQSDQAIWSRCIGTALPSLHSKFASIFAFIFFRILLGATLNAGEVSGLLRFLRFEFVAFILLDRNCPAHVSFA